MNISVYLYLYFKIHLWKVKKTTPFELSRNYGLAASTISTIVKNQESIKQASESTRDIKKAKRLRGLNTKKLKDTWI